MSLLQNSDMKSSKNDILLFFVMIALGVLLILIFSNETKVMGDRVRVTLNGNVYGEYPLNKDDTFTVSSEHGENVICIKDGEVYVESADCPDKICVKHAPVHYDKETIVCLPHRLTVSIISDKEADADAVSE